LQFEDVVFFHITQNNSLWMKLFGYPAPLTVLRAISGDGPASKQLIDVSQMPNLFDVWRRGGLDIDLTNKRVVINVSLIITEIVIIAVPIVITALIVGYYCTYI
jgi:hypothetical protein